MSDGNGWRAPNRHCLAARGLSSKSVPAANTFKFEHHHTLAGMHSTCAGPGPPSPATSAARILSHAPHTHASINYNPAQHRHTGSPSDAPVPTHSADVCRSLKCCQPVAHNERSKCHAPTSRAQCSRPHPTSQLQATATQPCSPACSVEAATQRPGRLKGRVFCPSRVSPTCPTLLSFECRNGDRNHCASQRKSYAICLAMLCHPQSSAPPGMSRHHATHAWLVRS